LGLFLYFLPHVIPASPRCLSMPIFYHLYQLAHVNP